MQFFAIPMPGLLSEELEHPDSNIAVHHYPEGEPGEQSGYCGA
jgi:hypothetical protein